MTFGEADTRAKLIDPALHACGWTEDLIRREETAGAIEMVAGKPRRRARGRVDYALRIKVNRDAQPVAVALIEGRDPQLERGVEEVMKKIRANPLKLPERPADPVKTKPR